MSTTATLGEVRQYLVSMARAYGIAHEVLEAQFRLLAITEYRAPVYRKWIPEAARRIGQRDPNDVELLALALALEIPIWTNDNDFKETGVTCYTTATLLKLLAL